MTQPVVPAGEMIVEEVAQRAFDTINRVVDVIAPDGRPFGQRKKSEKEQIREYLESGLHDNPEAALNWIRTRVSEIQKRLAGLPPEMVVAVHPYDIVQRFAMHYSARMEKLIAEQRSKDREAHATMAPTVPTEMMLETELDGDDY